MSPLATGTAVGNYTIVSVLGVGGMGEVYKAYDPALSRHIALKILPHELVNNEELLLRFIQEAKAASALNHPNIVTIYEIGTALVTAPDGDRYAHYISMELIDGETLRTKVLDPEFALPQKLDVLAQAADGLAKAHASGIVHRDLKPENIMVTREGFAKVLDFGLAKLLDRTAGLEASDDGETDILGQTKPGVLMGTFGYMAPEQVERRNVDLRADVFAFGVILHHVITGKNPFESKSAIDTLHAIVHDEAPSLGATVPGLPYELEWVAARCLAKEPDERYASMKEVAAALREVKRSFDTAPPGSSPRLSGPPRWGRRRRFAALWALAAFAAAVALVALIARLAAPKPAPFETMKIRRISETSRSVAIALSPDARYLVHAVDEGKGQSLWLRQVSTGSDLALVPLAAVHYVDCAISPNGDYVYYVSADNVTDVGSIYRVPLLGGGVTQTILRDHHGRIAISHDGKWLAYSTQDRKAGESRLMVIGADGTGRRVVSTRRLPDVWGAVAWGPHGKHIVAALGAYSSGFETRLVEVGLDGRGETTIGEGWRGIESIAWLGSSDGIVVNGKDAPTSTRNQLWLVDRPGGARRRITNDLNDYEAVSASRDGHALVSLQKAQTSRIWVAPGGDASRASAPVASSENIDGASGLTWTADGRVVYSSEGSDERELWIVPPAGGTPRRLTDGRSDVLPAATADGRHIVFVSTRAGQPNLWRINSDGSAPTRLTSAGQETAPSVSPDGRWIYYHTNRAGIRTIWRVSIDGGSPEQLTTQASSWPSVSPDGSRFSCSWWDAAQTKARIAIIPVGAATPETLLDIPVNYWMGSNNHLTRWTRDGKALTYVARRGGVANIWRQPIDGGAPEQLTRFTEGSEIFWFDWSKDGRDLACARGAISSHVVLLSDVR